MKTLQRTLAIIKPDAVARGAMGDILGTIERRGFRVLSAKMLRITREQAQGFYAVHAGKAFFESLTTFMSQGPILVMALERENGSAYWGEIMVAMNPADGKEGTVRKEWAERFELSAVHGSDSVDTAR